MGDRGGCGRGRGGGGGRGRRAYNDPKTLMQRVPEISEERQIELKRLVDMFVQSDQTSLQFPSDLTNQDRLYVHKLAEMANLKHCSRGSGQNRKLTLTKELTDESYFGYAHISDDCYLNLHETVHQRALTVRHRPPCRLSEAIPQPKPDMSIPPLVVAGVPPPVATSEEVIKLRQQLPVLAYKNDILETIKSHQFTLISAETGAGKTTQVPQYLLEQHARNGTPCLILCSQPRRLATVSAAERISFERGEQVGGTVGYCIKHERQFSDRTRLLLCTTGTLLRMMLLNPSLVSATSYLLIDEIHERDRFTDYLLAVVRERAPAFPRLKVVLMSACMNETLLTSYFGHCPLLRVPGRQFPVQQLFLEDILLFTRDSGHSSTSDDPQTELACEFSRKVSISTVDDEKGVGCQQRPMEDPDLVEESEDDLVCVAEECYITDEEGRAIRVTDELVDGLLDLFIRQGSTEALSLLLRIVEDKLAPVDFRHAATGMTLLMACCDRGLRSVVIYLLAVGASLNLAAANGLRAADFAARHPHLVPILANHYRYSEAAQLVRVDDCGVSEQELSAMLDAYHRAHAETDIDFQLIVRILHRVSALPDQGAVLVFLPGYDDIFYLRSLLQTHPLFSDTNKFRLFVLHSNVKTVDQKQVLDPCLQRKIILSTNIAETSLTIDDVTFVIDSGKVKDRHLDSISSASYSLQTSWTCKASVAQRKGRAGRTKPGVCFHLFSRTRYATMSEFATPEILRYPLSDMCLQTKLFFAATHSIIHVLSSVPQPPPPATIRAAVDHLITVGALDQEENLTKLGFFLVKLPLDPDLGVMLLHGAALRCLDPVVVIVSSLAYKSPFLIPSSREGFDDNAARKKALSYNSLSDHFLLLYAFSHWYSEKGRRRSEEDAFRFCQAHNLSVPVLEVIERTRRHILRHLASVGVIQRKGTRSFHALNAHANMSGCVRAAVFAGLAHSVVAYDAHRQKYCSDTCNKLKLHRNSVIQGQKGLHPPSWLCCDEISRSLGQPHIRSATAVDPFLLALLCRPVHTSRDHETPAAAAAAAVDDDVQQITFSLLRGHWLKIFAMPHVGDLILTLRTLLHLSLEMVIDGKTLPALENVISALSWTLQSLEPPNIGFMPVYERNWTQVADLVIFGREEGLFPI